VQDANHLWFGVLLEVEIVERERLECEVESLDVVRMLWSCGGQRSFQKLNEAYKWQNG